MSFKIFKNVKTPFQAIKTTSSKSRKFDIFPRGLTHGLGPKMAIFPTFFQALYSKINVFYDILERKNTFIGYKNYKFKKRKMDIFSKGLTHGFGPKMVIFPTFFFQAIQPSKVCFILFQNQKTPFQAIKRRSSKSEKIGIFPKGLTHGFGPKMAIFEIFFFQAIQARKMSFMIFQNEKTPFQTLKTRCSKSQSIDIFPIGLNHGFGPKMVLFQTFFFRQHRPGKCLL